MNRRAGSIFVPTAVAFLVFVLAASAADERAPSVWIRDRAALGRELDTLIGSMLSADRASDSDAVLDALLAAGSVEAAAPSGVEPDDDLALIGSSESLSALITSVRARLTGTVAGTHSSAVTDVLRRTFDAMRGLFRATAQPSVTITVRVDGSTVRLRRSTGRGDASRTPSAMTAWRALPSDAVFAGSTRLGGECSGVIESWIAALTGVSVTGLVLPVEPVREIAVAARFDRAMIPDILIVVPLSGDARDAVLRALLRMKIGSFAANLPMSEVKTEKRRVLRWTDAHGWTFPVQVNATDAPKRIGLWHANDGDSLLIVLGERPDALDWYVGAKRRHRTFGDLERDASATGDAAWRFSPTTALRETARVRGVAALECRTLSRLLERLPSSPSVVGSHENDNGVDVVTFDVGEWASVLAALDAVNALSAP